MTLLLVVHLGVALVASCCHAPRGRTVYRTDQVRRDLLDRDDLATDLRAAGFGLAPAPQNEANDPREGN